MDIPEIKHKDRNARRKAKYKKSEAVLELERLADETTRSRHPNNPWLTPTEIP